MTQLKMVFRAHLWETGFALCLALLFAYLAQRHGGAYPSVFADEQIYSLSARMVPLRDATIPSYLYFSAYGLTDACGNGFLDCARYLNLVFFIGAAPFIFLATRALATRPAALMAALMSVAAPAKTYTAYFMPEAMYFFGFAVLTWLALARSAMHWAKYALATGAVLGLMTLVKVHALFLVPALALFMLYQAWNLRAGGPWLGRGSAAMLLGVGAVFVVKFGLGYAFGGARGLSLLGSLYGTQAGNSLAAGTTLLTLLPAALFSLKGHLMMLVLLFAMPLAALLHHLLSPGARSAAGRQTGALMAWAVLMTGAALGLTVLFTASTAGYGPLDGLRLHARYYNFTFMLLPMIAAAAAGDAASRWPGALRTAVAAALAALLVFATVALPSAYLFLLADGPEIVSLGLGKEGSLATLVLALQVAILALWAMRPALGGPAFLFVLLPLLMFNGEKMTDKQVALTHSANLYDRAGLAVRDYLGREQRAQLTIAGDNPGELLRTRFQADAPGVETVVLPPGWPLRPYALPGRKRWLLVIGDHALPPNLTPVITQPGFVLGRQPDNRSLGAVKMTEPLENTLLSGAEGLAGAEGWGRWSNADQVRLHFRQPLPKRLNLFLTLKAFGPNVGKDFKVRVGQSETLIQLPPLPQELYLRLQTDGTEKTLTIEVPQAVSPNELGISGDTRRLGLGITRVEIGTPVDAD